MANFGAVLDACVLVPVSLADTLLWIAEYDVYRPAWSKRILDEVRAVLLRVHPSLGAGRIEGAAPRHEATFPDSCVRGWEPLVAGITLPDPNDRHVVAAGLRGRAEVILTHNVIDFPDSVIDPLGLHVRHPDDFLLDTLDLAPGIVRRVLAEQAADARRPPLGVTDVLASLERAGVPRFAHAATDLHA